MVLIQYSIHYFICFLLFWIPVDQGPELYTKNMERKVFKSLSKIYEGKELEVKELTSRIEIPKNQFLIESTVLRIATKEDANLGHVVIARAPSKTATFDYYLIFDSQWVLKEAKVALYREDYGGEISSKRWLSQFYGAKQGTQFQVGEDIAAISGATISVHAMTRSLNHILAALNSFF
jgi:hypothetical protein